MTLFMMMTSINAYYGNWCGSIDNDDVTKLWLFLTIMTIVIIFITTTQVVLEGAEGTLWATTWDQDWKEGGEVSQYLWIIWLLLSMCERGK